MAFSLFLRKLTRNLDDDDDDDDEVNQADLTPEYAPTPIEITSNFERRPLSSFPPSAAICAAGRRSTRPALHSGV